MLFRNNEDLFKTIKALAGVNDFTTEETANLVDLTNRRLFMAYNTSPMWDRYVVAGEKRNVSAFNVTGWTSTDANHNGLYYNFGEDSNGNAVFIPVNSNSTDQDDSIVVFKDNTNGWAFGHGTYTKSLTDGTISGSYYIASNDYKQRDTSIDYDSPTDVIWNNPALQVTSMQVVAYNEVEDVIAAGDTRYQKETIGDYIRIHKDKSFLNNSSMEYNFYVDNHGAHILNAKDVNSVFVTYKKLLAGSGTTTMSVPVSSLSSGSTIPAEFFNYTAHAVYADFLRMDGQHDKAAFEEQKAELFLATELERIDIINNNNSLNHKFSTYVNTSSR
tara:strand:- start:674 stop:1663 length:990 start_codon:yes stop_codon:yes gene_type:complete